MDHLLTSREGEGNVCSSLNLPYAHMLSWLPGLMTDLSISSALPTAILYWHLDGIISHILLIAPLSNTVRDQLAYCYACPELRSID